MYPREARLKELRARFGVQNGQFFAYYEFKNLNWYLADKDEENMVKAEWFCFGDIREEDMERLPSLLREGEKLILGWKDLGPDTREKTFFGDGGGVWLVIEPEGVTFDIRIAEDLGRLNS